MIAPPFFDKKIRWYGGFFSIIFDLCPYLSVGSENLRKGNHDEDGVQDEKNEKSSILSGIQRTTRRGIIQEISYHYNDWHEPPGEIPPGAENFFFHFVGDEGKEKDCP